MIQFGTAFLVFGLNAVLLVALIRWRGLFTCEGLGAGLLLVVITSDFGGLVANYLRSPDDWQILDALSSRAVPGIVHAFGLVALGAGLFLASPRPSARVPVLTEPSRTILLRAGVVLVCLGLGMKFLELYAAGVRSLYQYVANLYYFTVYQSTIGGFLGNGTAIAVLGLSVLIAVGSGRPGRLVFLFAVLFAVSTTLSTSRADLTQSLFILVATVGMLNQRVLRAVLAKKLRALLIGIPLTLLLLVNAGVKSQVRMLTSTGSIEALDLSVSRAIGGGQGRFLDRFSSQGLYEGYCNFVNRLLAEEAPMWRGRAIGYAATAWIPHFIYQDKPQHPFRAIGFLVYDDRHTSLDDVSATTLVGSAFADFGLWSVLVYLVCFGVFLGLVRRRAMDRASHPLAMMWYLHFTLVDSASHFIHGGVMAVFDSVALATGVLALMYVCLEMSNATGFVLRSALRSRSSIRRLEQVPG